MAAFLAASLVPVFAQAPAQSLWPRPRRPQRPARCTKATAKTAKPARRLASEDHDQAGPLKAGAKTMAKPRAKKAKPMAKTAKPAMAKPAKKKPAAKP